MGRVTEAEAHHIRVQAELFRGGYESKHTEDSSFSMLDITILTRRRRSFWLFEGTREVKCRAAELIFCHHKIKNLKADKEWLMRVYGREFLEKCRALAKGLADKFDVDIHLRLETEKTLE